MVVLELPDDVLLVDVVVGALGVAMCTTPTMSETSTATAVSEPKMISAGEPLQKPTA
jgi:hypothetical protein